ncbi:MAG TPA: hypothetical protein PKK95_00750 [Vicinamibacterales bacterium]|nr:hypothetical protein [Acidobacteriota bacterium]HOC16761.1 hypothetical protein [Vicinamibacterales bacterium]
MKRKWLASAAAFGIVALMGVPVLAQEMKMSAVPQSPEWQKLATLVGHWEGVYEAPDGTKMNGTLEVRMTGDNSAIMHLMNRDAPHEMVTMIHPDGKRLLATHYCAAHNHPRMALVPSKNAGEVAFDFVDGTNIAPGEHYMRKVIFRFVDADHHEEEWTAMGSDGKLNSAVFKYTRVKK